MRLLLPVALDEPRAHTDAAVHLADRLGAELLVLHALSPMVASPLLPDTGLGFETPAYVPFDPQTRREIERAEALSLERFVQERFARPVRTALREGDPVEVILEDARTQGVEMIVLGHHRHGLLERLLTGSVARSVLERAPCPVVVIPLEPHQ